MDNEEKRDVHMHVHSQDEQDYSQPTKPDMNKDCVRSGFSADCVKFQPICYPISPMTIKSYKTQSTKMNKRKTICAIEKAIAVVSAR